MADPMETFDLLGPLPTGTTVLEASAGTGKTYTVGALVARYVAEGVATLPEMLVITFGRAASAELRERVRGQLVEAAAALADPAAARARGGLLAHLAGADDAEVALRRSRLVDALADVDSATIATTHQFCQLVLRSLGVAGDTDAHARLVEDLDDLVVEVTDDLFLRRFGDLDAPPFDRAEALRLARAAVGDPQAVLSPPTAEPGSAAAARVGFAEAVRVELERRKQRRGVLSYDDLLSRLASALEPGADGATPPAAARMRRRWSVVLVDEFQDTDPVQWRVIDGAFSGHATVVLIGDPKQAIYAFRGGDVVSYLAAAETAGTRRTLGTNYRSDAPLVEALQVLTAGAALGDPRIAVHPVGAHHTGSRLDDPLSPAPIRLRVVPHGDEPVHPIGRVRAAIATDLADDVARLLTSGATFDPGDGPRPVRAGDIAILMFSLRQAEPFRAALAERGVPTVVAGTGGVLTSPAGDEWLVLLEALERQQANRVRSLALTSFVGATPAELVAGGDDLTDALAERVRGWLDLVRSRGIAAVHEAVVAEGLVRRVLARPGGERLLTDLEHVGEILHGVAQRERLGVPALLEWFRAERRADVPSGERVRRLDTDAAAVQILTVHGSKGLQFPVVHLPLLFNRWIPDERSEHLYHLAGERMLDISGPRAASSVVRQAQAEDAAEELRLTYVALTRAQSRVVAWWAPTRDSRNAGLTRLLLGRAQGEAAVPEKLQRVPDPVTLAATLGAWEQAGGLVVERVEPSPTSVPPDVTPDVPLAARSFDRDLDEAWRRTSYSALIRVEEQAGAVGHATEPEEPGTVDEDAPEGEPVVGAPVDAPADGPVSPMEGLPAGATFGSLVHAVLEVADPTAPDLLAELRARVEEQRRWWSVDASTDDLAAGLLPLHDTPLGPLADGLTLRDLPLADRLCELDFEIPLDGGDGTGSAARIRLADLARLVREHLAADDPMRAYADRLEAGVLGEQVLRGYLSGSIDAVLRVPDPVVGHRYVVVDYKTNRLGEPGRPLTALDYTPERMTEAMLGSHYPLQALLYAVVVHRYLRWRLPGYDPERHLGGVLYLYVRGMCGADTPVVDGVPCGVFTWHPPAALVVAWSDLLAGRGAVA